MNETVMIVANTCMLAAISGQLLSKSSYMKVVRFVLGLEIMAALLSVVQSFTAMSCWK